MSKDKGRIISITGPSGVGKGTLGVYAVATLPNCAVSVSATTRPIRPTEVDGREYHFLTEEAFKGKIAGDGFIEWAKYGNNYYGTPYSSIEDLIADGKNVIIELEVQGALQLMRKIPDVISVFIMPPAPHLITLRTRLEARVAKTGESTDIEERLAIAKKEIAQAHHFERIIVNGDLERAKGIFVGYIAQQLGISTI